MGPWQKRSSLVLVQFLVVLFTAFWLTSVAVAQEYKAREISSGVMFEKNVTIEMADGNKLYANVFRPKAEGHYPVLLSMSIYGKDIHTRDFNSEVWHEMNENIEGLCENSSCNYHAWEVPDPEVWVADGYVVIRVDARGSGKSSGKIDPFSAQETQDLYDAIEWAGVQSWSNGRVGLTGISYYGIVQWKAAALRPPHLKAIAPWEGAVDAYRDSGRHGGILSNVFVSLWADRQLVPVQNGNSESHFTDMDDGEPVGGPIALSEEELAQNRTNLIEDALTNKLDNAYYSERTALVKNIEVPILSAANWGGFGLHSRGNFTGFVQAGSDAKWLNVHTGDHVGPYYERAGIELQKQFYDHYLKGDDNGWETRPRVFLDIRHADGAIERRAENEWPLARTKWKKLFLDASNSQLTGDVPTSNAVAEYIAMENSITFSTPPLLEEVELTGPMAAKLFVSSSTSDMDIFATVQAFAPDGTEITFQGATDPATPISQGWLRVSHRKLDLEKSKPWQPYHSHDEQQPLEPNEIYEVDVEIWPGQVVLPKGYTLALRIEGKDFVRPRPGVMGWAKDILMDKILHLNVGAGSGFFLHNHPDDRPENIYNGTNRIYTGAKHRSYFLVPVIPEITKSAVN